MIRTFILVLGGLVATPVLANFGDLDAQILEFKPDVVFVAQPVTLEADRIVSPEICPLPLDHIVSIPDSFPVGTDVAMVCLEN